MNAAIDSENTHPGQPAGRASLHGESESGVVLLVLLASALPLLILAGAALSTMNGRSKAVSGALDAERAFLAAEAGIDQFLYVLNGGTVSGSATERTFDDGSSFTIVGEDLKTDGIDNDGDTQIDEADEAVFRAIVLGQFREARTRLVAYFRPVTAAPPVAAGIYLAKQNLLDLDENSSVTGEDTNIDGSRGDPTQDIYGVAIGPPGTVANLTSELDASESLRVTGRGGTPSVTALSTPIDLATLVAAVQANANIVLGTDYYSNLNFGNSSTGTYNIIYRNGRLRIEDTSRGAGIMVVKGEFEARDDFRFDGVIIVLGRLRLEGETSGSGYTGGAQVFGTIIQGPDASSGSMEEFRLRHDTRVQFSKQVLDQISLLLSTGKYRLSAWQETSRL